MLADLLRGYLGLVGLVWVDLVHVVVYYIRFGFHLLVSIILNCGCCSSCG